MLNKELLLAPAKGELEYTHIVTVGKLFVSSTMDYYGYAMFQDGAISPKYILNSDTQIPLQSLYSVPEAYVTSLLTDSEFLPDYLLIFVGRPDKRICMRASSGNSEEGSASWRGFSLFTPEDLGKEIPIWLSYERPPWYDEHSGGVGN